MRFPKFESRIGMSKTCQYTNLDGQNSTQDNKALNEKELMGVIMVSNCGGLSGWRWL